jgi:exopolysaccharide biosynthesis polyprenyl glycosylphosphotransferase
VILDEHRRQGILYAASGAGAFAAALIVAIRIHPIVPSRAYGPALNPPGFEALALATAMWTLAAAVVRLHRPRPGRIEDLLSITKAAAIAGGLVLMSWYAAHLEPPPRITALIAFGLAVVFIALARELTRRLIAGLYSSPNVATPLVIVGFNPLGTYVCDQVLDEVRHYELVGFLDDAHAGATYRGLGVLGGIEALGGLAERYHGLEAAIIEPDASNERIDKTVRACEHLHVRWKVMPPMFRSLSVGLTVDMAGVVPLIGPRSSNIEGLNFALKRLFDFSVASILLIVGAPFMALAALATLVFDGRPLMFRQTRIGIHGRRFELLKFRTMRTANSDAIHRNYVRQWIRPSDGAAATGNGTGPVFKLTADPRVTPVGRWLRRFSIDELPQLINVLRGEMSLIGPRPALPYEVECYEDWHRRRLEAPPGITGLWQVSGRNHLSFEEMVRLDIQYIEDWSLGQDLAILFRTVPAMIHGDGA